MASGVLKKENALPISSEITDTDYVRFLVGGNISANIKFSDFKSFLPTGGGDGGAITLNSNLETIFSLVSNDLAADAQGANKVWAGPTSGGSAVPTFRNLVSADLPAPANNSITLNKLEPISTAYFLGRSSAGSGNVESLSATTVKQLLGLAAMNTTPAGSTFVANSVGAITALTSDPAKTQYLVAVNGLIGWADGTASGNDIAGAALTAVNDVNVTLTMGGLPNSALLRATSITVGWLNQLAVIRGGTGTNTMPVNYLVKGNGINPFQNSILYDSGLGIGIGTTNPQGDFHVQNSAGGGATCYVSATGTGNSMAAFVLGGSNLPTTDAGAIFYTRSTYTTSGLWAPSSFYVDGLDSGGLWLGSRNAAGKVHFYSGGFNTSNENAVIDGTGLTVGAVSRTRNIVNYVQDGKSNAAYKTQSISLVTSTKPAYISGMTDLGGTSTIVPCNYTALNFTSTDTSFSWYNTYHSRVYIAPGAGGEPRISSAYGTQFTGFVHEIECKGKSQDLSAVFHSVYIHGQAAGERAETTGFYYNHMVGGNPWATYNANEGLGKYYDTIIEGQQYIVAAGSGSAGAHGWFHNLFIRDTVTDPAFDKYTFIIAHNGIKTDFTGFDPDFDAHSGAVAFGACGKWNKLIGLHADYVNVPLKIQECTVDLHTNVTYNGYLPAIKISKNSYFDLCGETAGRYYIGVSNASNNDAGYIGIIAGGVAVMSFSSGQVNITGNLFTTIGVSAPLVYGTTGLGVNGPLYFGPTNSLKVGLQMGGDNYTYVGAGGVGTYVNIGGVMKRLSVDGSGFVKAS